MQVQALSGVLHKTVSKLLAKMSSLSLQVLTITNFSPVPLIVFQELVLLIIWPIASHIFLGILVNTDRCRPCLFFQVLEIDGPDFLTIIVGQGFVKKFDMNTRKESIIEGADAIGREKHNALKLLKLAEED